MKWVVALGALAVVAFAVAYAVGGEAVGRVLPVFAAVLWGGIVIGLVLKVFRKPRPGGRTADRAALAEWEATYLGRKHAQPTFEEREPARDHSLVLDQHDLPPVFLPEDPMRRPDAR
ncbi:hypothetical protein [Agromyces aerolatus]|uniref:hypothetical protein n=1 Tax=Agromyces sp. LY-1074 TaxID=3074080 RepID=UPI0028564DF3|nr:MULTISPECIES: hypothetical protein [unclassified Agromyces]MDR5699287.1 hypothetical protein [Agromyces sp. LY-1074]MDR5705583.1 hypothetical protein [Agromyces sp. LY-1358]